MIRLLCVCFLVASVSAQAGDWHVAGSLECEDCHLQHSTDRSGAIAGGPYSYMLKKVSINELCLSCHDGSNISAPDVFAPVQMYSTSPSQQSGAGFFTSIASINHLGHSIGIMEPIPLKGSSKSVSLTCASCHAVHGNGSFRNLLTDPGESGATFMVLDGSSVFTERAPDNPPTAIGSSAAYSADNVGYATDDMSAWCASCHDLLSNNSLAAPPAHFNGHPSGVAMNANVIDAHVDADHWVAGIGEGFSDSPGGTARVPFVAPLATNFLTSRSVGPANQVACISCHKAHGSSNQTALLWPYEKAEAKSISGCQQCHNQ